ncbi:MAG TPA: DUF5908 family protein [Allosphingosinicella sp.]|jgi:hypothetical protein
MPLEVREIGIKLSVGDDRGAAQAAPESGGCGATLSSAERRRIVEECVAAVIAALQDAERR